MIVDKDIELEIKILKDYPQWDFLPVDDLNRKTIEIFFEAVIFMFFLTLGGLFEINFWILKIFKFYL